MTHSMWWKRIADTPAVVLARLTLVTAAIALIALPVLAAGRLPRTFPKRVDGPAVAFTETAVLVRGATPGSTVYFAGVTLAPAEYTIRVETPAGTAVADADGAAEFPAAIDTRSVWIVTDGSKGGYTVASPPGMLLREIDFPGRSEVSNGDVRRVVLERYAIATFLIRPGAGIWSANLRDGGPGDEDGEMNGRSIVELRSLNPRGGAPSAADRLEPGDVLFMVDLNTLEFHALRRGH